MIVLSRVKLAPNQTLRDGLAEPGQPLSPPSRMFRVLRLDVLFRSWVVLIWVRNTGFLERGDDFLSGDRAVFRRS